MPAWVIVDEFNTDDLSTSWAVEDVKRLESLRASSCRELLERRPLGSQKISPASKQNRTLSMC